MPGFLAPVDEVLRTPYHISDRPQASMRVLQTQSDYSVSSRNLSYRRIISFDACASSKSLGATCNAWLCFVHLAEHYGLTVCIEANPISLFWFPSNRSRTSGRLRSSCHQSQSSSSSSFSVAFWRSRIARRPDWRASLASS